MYRFKNKILLHKALDFALTSKVKSQDLRTVFSIAEINPSSRDIFFSWTKKHWKKIEKQKETHHIFADFLSALIKSQISIQKKNEIQKFLKDKNIQYEKTKANAFELLHTHNNFINKNAKILEDYFMEN